MRKSAIVGKRAKPPVSGVVVVKKRKIAKDSEHTYNCYEEIESKPYLSIHERRSLITMLCGKWHVDDVRVFVSVIPDVK